MSALNRLMLKPARLAELMLAAVFLAGAFMKASDINLFMVQISHYGVISNRTLVAAAAVATLAVETALGLALLFKIRLRGLTYAAIVALLVVFTGLILYGWQFNNLQDCGCFGPIEVSPGASVVKNALIALTTLAVWFSFKRAGHLSSPLRRLAVLLPATALIALGVSFYAYVRVEAPPAPEARRFAEFVFEDEYGGKTDLGAGEHLVVILSMTCDHCMESVAHLNELTSEPAAPKIIGLCYEDSPGALEQFKDATLPEFPMFSLGDSVGTFFSLIGNAPPRLWLVRDGRQVHYWDDEVPSIAEVIDALEGKLVSQSP